LYGCNLNVDFQEQFLVYEYAANGSLARFFRDDGERARLEADRRLSIMYELARAVHFLHTGGCEIDGNGWRVFHRDIKSANICLTEDFTAKLIDCGLAKFVADGENTPQSNSITPTSTSQGPVFGSRGYRCPDYSGKILGGKQCPFKAENDVYSIGVVLAELILGRLNLSKHGEKVVDIFETYVQDEHKQPIKDGWKLLKEHADGSIIWKPKSLELVCKSAIKCMAPSPGKRLSTNDLVNELKTSILVHDGTLDSAPKGVALGQKCAACNQKGHGIMCSGSGYERHAWCTPCIRNTVSHYLSGGCDVVCLINGCSGEPFQDEDLNELLSVETYTHYIARRAEHNELNREVKLLRGDVRAGFEHTTELLLKQQKMLQNLAEGLDRSLAALSLLAANLSKECPNLVWITPKSVKNWVRNPLMQKYNVVFICAHSGGRGHEPFEILVPKGWIAKVAPWLKLSLAVVKFIVNAHGLPFPIPDLPFPEQCDWMNEFLESVVEEETKAVLNDCETLLEKGTVTIDTSVRMQELAGGAFKMIADKAKKEKRSHLWMPPVMVPVLNENGTPIWVKKEFEKHYRVWKD
jgi:hypothetical protein